MPRRSEAHPPASASASAAFLQALHAQRAALASAPQATACAAPPPAPRGFAYDPGTQRHWPLGASAGGRAPRSAPAPQQQQQLLLLPSAPAARSCLAALRARECGGLRPAPSALHFLEGRLASCVRAWAPALPQRLPPYALECAVPATLAAHPLQLHLAWNARGGAASWRGGSGSGSGEPAACAFAATDSPVTGLAWDARGAQLARVTLGGGGACARLCVDPPPSGSSAAPAGNALRLPPTASAWGLQWLSQDALCVPLQCGGRAALVRRAPSGGLTLARTMACGAGGGRQASDALVAASAPASCAQASAPPFLVGLRDGRAFLCDDRAGCAPPVSLVHLPGTPTLLSPLPTVSPYALLAAALRCAGGSGGQRCCLQLWDVRRTAEPSGALQGVESGGKGGRFCVHAERGVIAHMQGDTGHLQAWVAGSSSACSLLPLWRARARAPPLEGDWLAGAGSSGSGAPLVPGLHAMGLFAPPAAPVQLLVLSEGRGAEEPPLLQRFSPHFGTGEE